MAQIMIASRPSPRTCTSRRMSERITKVDLTALRNCAILCNMIDVVGHSKGHRPLHILNMIGSTQSQARYSVGFEIAGVREREANEICTFMPDSEMVAVAMYATSWRW